MLQIALGNSADGKEGRMHRKGTLGCEHFKRCLVLCIKDYGLALGRDVCVVRDACMRTAGY